MKRSEINRRIRDAERFFADHCFHLPPFARWTPDDWKGRGHEADEIRNHRLGWDLTDFGRGDFDKEGLLLFTIRNGDPTNPDDPRCYAEKVMIVGDGQLTPWHFHWKKTEDIINRGGGDLVLGLAWATEDEGALDRTRDVEAVYDGVRRKTKPAEEVSLRPGESISLPPKLYHMFYAAAGKGSVLVGEVSRTNDDETDNGFLEKIGRFPKIEEDEVPYRLLCTEYPRAET